MLKYLHSYSIKSATPDFCKIKIELTDILNCTALHYSALHGNLKCCKYLIENKMIVLEQRNSHNELPIDLVQKDQFELK